MKSTIKRTAHLGSAQRLHEAEGTKFCSEPNFIRLI